MTENRAAYWLGGSPLRRVRGHMGQLNTSDNNVEVVYRLYKLGDRNREAVSLLIIFRPWTLTILSSLQVGLIAVPVL